LKGYEYAYDEAAVKHGRCFRRKFGEGETRHKTKDNYGNNRDAGIEYAVQCQGSEIGVTPRYGIISEKKLFWKSQLAGEHILLGCF
jgi:hypothetical protein